MSVCFARGSRSLWMWMMKRKSRSIRWRSLRSGRGSAIRRRIKRTPENVLRSIPTGNPQGSTLTENLRESIPNGNRVENARSGNQAQSGQTENLQEIMQNKNPRENMPTGKRERTGMHQSPGMPIGKNPLTGRNGKTSRSGPGSTPRENAGLQRNRKTRQIGA